MRMALPMIDSNVRSKANTSRQSLMQVTGLDDNQLQAVDARMAARRQRLTALGLRHDGPADRPRW